MYAILRIQYTDVLNVCADEIVGYDATIGFTHWANKPSTRDAFVSYSTVLMTLMFILRSARRSVQKSRSYHHCQN